MVTLDLAFVNSRLYLDNGVMKSLKRREIMSLVFSCLCIIKSLLIRIQKMATFILEEALSVSTNWSKHLLLAWLCVSSFKMAHTRRIMHIDDVFCCKSWTMQNGRLFIRTHRASCACLYTRDA